MIKYVPEQHSRPIKYLILGYVENIEAGDRVVWLAVLEELWSWEDIEFGLDFQVVDGRVHTRKMEDGWEG